MMIIYILESREHPNRFHRDRTSVFDNSRSSSVGDIRHTTTTNHALLNNGSTYKGSSSNTEV